MKCSIKEATIRALHDTSLDKLQTHLKNYLWIYNSALVLRALKSKPLIGFILEQWQRELEKFCNDLSHYVTEPYT